MPDRRILGLLDTFLDEAAVASVHVLDARGDVVASAADLRRPPVPAATIENLIARLADKVRTESRLADTFEEAGDVCCCIASLSGAGGVLALFREPSHLGVVRVRLRHLVRELRTLLLNRDPDPGGTTGSADGSRAAD